MGLDTTHNCWHGAYSSFMRWRIKLCEVSGYGNIFDYDYFWENDTRISKAKKPRPWPENNDILIELLTHSDCDGEILSEKCGSLADRLEQLLPALKVCDISNEASGYCDRFSDITNDFIKGLRLAFKKKENVEFH